MEVTRIAVFEFAFDQLAIGKLLTRVASRPFTGDEGLDQIKLARLEAFELRCVVFVEPVGDAVKVEHTRSHIDLASPVVRVAVITDVATKSCGACHIRATGNRKLGDDFVKRFTGCAVLLPPARAKHGHGTDDQRQFWVGLFEFKTDCAGV